MAIPVIDFSKLNGEKRAETMALIDNGCKEWGFFQLVNHGIPEELLERVKTVCSDCYKLEREEVFKKSLPVRLLNDLVEKKNPQNLENADWEDVFLVSDDSEWPSKTPEFKKTMVEYRANVKKLAEKLLEVMDENLGFPKGYMKKLFNGGEEEDKGLFGTKVSHYPPCPHPAMVFGLRPHTDAGGVILLFQDDKVGGLQILKDGAWIDVHPLSNAIVINMGDQIEVVSNGQYKSAWHRVVATPYGNRRSIATFYNPCLKATIAPAQQLLHKGQPHHEPYPNFVFGDYMSVYEEQKFLSKESRFQTMRTMKQAI